MPHRSVRTLLTACMVAVVFAAGLSASHSWGGYHRALQDEPVHAEAG